MAREWSEQDVGGVVRVPTRSDDKYSRGVLGVRTGSKTYPGAAVLGVESAWRTGLGMVRYLGAAADPVLARRPETVTAPGRVQAWLIGSGTDSATRDVAETSEIRRILAQNDPVVLDAGALDLAPGATAPVIVTPHAREHVVLRRALGMPDGTGDRHADVVETARAIGGVVLLKGAETLVTDGGEVLVVDTDVPWLATAGTGDVLGGVVGALVANAFAMADAAPSLSALAATGAWLHGRAAGLAASALGPSGGPLVALDVAEALPRAVAEVLARTDRARPTMGA